MVRALLFLAPFQLLAADVAIRGFPPAAIPAEQAWEAKAQSLPDPQRIRDTIQKLADKPHLAGTPASKVVADYLAAQLREWGLDTQIEEFQGLLPRPQRRALEILEPTVFKAKLAEPAIAGDKNSDDPKQVPPYNAYSGNGDVTAPLVYVNYGVPADYDYLARISVSVKGKIVIVRYGASWRGVKPKVAQEHGAVGCIIYSDPKEDGYYRGDVYPKGPFRPAGGVQRGSVLDITISPGDPLSPGFASVPGAKRLPLSEAKTLMKIPVLPISYGDARPLLESLGGVVAPADWRGALPITYHIGAGNTKVHLNVEMDNSSHPLYDVMVRIPGSEFPDQWVMYGNHHDAWVLGAHDPLSGAASLMETAHTLSALLKQGWKPKRTIILALWDGEEFGLMGSTEWCELHAADINSKLVAYINSDSNGRGRLSAGGSHTLESFVSEIARDILDPETGKSVLESMRSGITSRKGNSTADTSTGFRLAALGSGSDYTPFLQHAGVASLSLNFGDDSGGGIYHSTYDDFAWYSRFGDPTFAYGKALSGVTGTSLLRLADAPLLPFEFTRYAKTIARYVDEIDGIRKSDRPNLSGLRKAVEELAKSADVYESAYTVALPKLDGASPQALRTINTILFQTERTMALPQGLPNRDWYRHRIYAPGSYTGYAVKTLPGIREAVEADRIDEAVQQAQQVEEIVHNLEQQIQEAARLLSGL